MKQKATPGPPQWAKRLLERITAPHLIEELEGDLEELFRKRMNQHGSSKARWLYLLDILLLLHPRLWRKQSSTTLYTQKLPLAMLTHHLLLAYRTLLRFKGSFVINLTGLSTGLACALLIYLWVSDEWAMDRFHQKKDRLFQVMRHTQGAGSAIDTHESNSVLLPAALSRELPEVEQVVPVRAFDKGILSSGNKHVKAKGKCVGKDFFHLFSFPLRQGNADQVLADKNGMVISDALAIDLFGSVEKAVGNSLHWDGAPYEGTYLVSGVFEKPPRHSSQQFDFLLNYNLFMDKLTMDKSWDSNPVNVYLTLKEGVDAEAFAGKLYRFYQSKMEPLHGAKPVNHLFLARYPDRYLYNQYENGQQAGGRIEYVRLFSIIGVFILLIAAINFMNLSTAKASRRTKEVGVKKVMGASRRSLIGQYLTEALLISLAALLLAGVLVALLLPEFNQITGKQLGLHWDADLLLAILLITLVTGLLAGSYPALYLSGFNPVTVLKNRLPLVGGQAWVRKGLVVFQFSLSVLFMVSVVVVYQQIAFIHKKNLGYSKDNILRFAAEGKLNTAQGLETFLSQVKQLPGVVNASSMNGNMTGAHSSSWGFEWEGKQPGQEIDFGIFYVNHGLIETLGIPLAQGRSFSPKFGSEETSILFNEAAISAMGLKEPLGKTVNLFGKDRQIVGVVKNFHFESLYDKIKPACFVYRTGWSQQVLIKISAGREQATLRQLEQLYRDYNLGLALEYQFLDEDYQLLYAAEQRVAVLSKYFAGLTIVISCLGLLGLTAFTAERRRKEIGIRKVLGATELGIVQLLSGDFTRLVLLAILLALPLSYLLAQEWLSTFAYQIELEPWYFLLAGLLALGTTLLTVGLQALKAARMNPVQSLKDE